MVNQTLNNRYHITARLGEGAMGEVFRATDTETHQEVALKVLGRHLTLKSDMVERFRREGEVLRQLQHPNIVGIIDTFQHDGQQVIVLEFVSGGNLHELIRRGPLSVNQARRLGLELCDALTRAHHLQIIHRDLKPENVLLTPDGTPKLTDFGVARLVSESARLTGTGTQVGTPFYMSPEAWQGERLDGQADIWSLGIMLYELLTGQVPFGGETLVAVMHKVLTAPLPDVKTQRPDTPPEMVKIVRQMLARDKAKRYQTVREVALDLERVPDSKAESRAPTLPSPAPSATSRASEPAKPAIAAPPAPRTGRRARWALAISAMAAAGLLGAAGLGWWGLPALAAGRATQAALAAAWAPTQTHAPTATVAPTLTQTAKPTATATATPNLTAMAAGRQATQQAQETRLALTPSPTFTPWPSPSPTPLPPWVTDFAQPILAAVAGRPTNFEDSFAASNGWTLGDWCGPYRMKYKDGGLILSSCSIAHASIAYPDFVATVDAQLMPDSAPTGMWVFKFRDTQDQNGCMYGVSIDANGAVGLGKLAGDYVRFPAKALPKGQTNHLTVIALGSQFAIYLNGQPFQYAENSACPYGTIGFRAHDDVGKITSIVKLSNFKLWNIAKMAPITPTPGK